MLNQVQHDGLGDGVTINVIPNLIRDPSIYKISFMKPGYVYIMANKPYGTLYIGVSSDLMTRCFQHKEGTIPGFTKTYGTKTLVYYEAHDRIDDAILREKKLKNWHRDWKIDLINHANPDWKDLSQDWMDAESSSA